jgi:hypothetical protein
MKLAELTKYNWNQLFNKCRNCIRIETDNIEIIIKVSENSLVGIKVKEGSYRVANIKYSYFFVEGEYETTTLNDIHFYSDFDEIFLELYPLLQKKEEQRKRKIAMEMI